MGFSSVHCIHSTQITLLIDRNKMESDFFKADTYVIRKVEKSLNTSNYNSITMVMDTIQVRLSHGIVKRIDELVETGVYSSRSDVLRDAVRRLFLDKLVGILQSERDSVKEVREIRKKLSKENVDLEEINKLAN